MGRLDGKACHIANYRDRAGNIVAQKIRLAGKKFAWRGDAKAVGLFGDHLWSKGRRLVITEGEIDALSVSQAQENKWPVVSLPNGAASAVKTLKGCYDYLDGFEEIVLMFDQDEPGRDAAAAAAAILPAGKVKIATLPLKDANECLKAGRPGDIVQAMWNARPWRPDGIIGARDLREKVRSWDFSAGLPYPFSTLNSITRGIRPEELVVITSGSGLGKSTLVREIAYDLHANQKQRVGMVMLEESSLRTINGLIGLHLNRNILADPGAVPEDERMAAFDDLLKDRDVHLYDHFGSTEVDNICNRIRYMAKACDCTHIFLDHVSIMISGLAVADERKQIDLAMTALRTLVQETKISLFVVSHLRRPHGDKGHEDGAEVSLSHLRGSHSIVQLADMVIGLQKPATDPTADVVEITVLKNRYTGERASAGVLTYDRQTGRMKESPF